MCVCGFSLYDCLVSSVHSAPKKTNICMKEASQRTLTVCTPVCLSVCLSVCVSVSVFVLAGQPAYQSDSLSICLSINMCDSP